MKENESRLLNLYIYISTLLLGMMTLNLTNNGHDIPSTSVCVHYLGLNIYYIYKNK